MVIMNLPLSGITYGQQLNFHGICQLPQFPAYVAPDYQQVFAESHERHSYQTVVALYDIAVPNVSQFVDDISSLLPKQSTLTRMPLEAGEQLKTPEQVARVAQQFGSFNIGIKSVMLIIGGGTLCNFGGFLATMWNGMEPVFIPTNYTAIADVAIGSLHMLNVGMQKNRLQLYRDPLAVAFDPRFIATLPISERRSGLVETVKHGIAQDSALFDYMEKNVDDGTIFDDATVFDLALRTAQLKDKLLQADPFCEHTQGIFLYGHVIAHAIESATNYSMPHGEAVSLGLLVELAFFHQPATAIFTRVKSLLDKLGLPTQAPRNLTAEKIITQLHHMMIHDDMLLIPRIGQIGALQVVNGQYSAGFDLAAIRNALNVII